MRIDDLPIEHYVPHRGAMLLLDRLLSADDDGAVAQVTVPRDGLFLQDAGMPAWVGMEYMAQAVAAWAGWRAHRQGRPVQVGYLLGSRRYEAAQAFFAPGSRLRVSVHCELLGDNGLGMFDCRIDAQDATDGPALATARIAVFEPADTSPAPAAPTASA